MNRGNASLVLGLLAAAAACSIATDGDVSFEPGGMGPTAPTTTGAASGSVETTAGSAGSTSDGLGESDGSGSSDGPGGTGETTSGPDLTTEPTGDGSTTGAGTTGTAGTGFPTTGSTGAATTGGLAPPIVGGTCGGMTQYVAASVTTPELHVVGVYEADSGDAITVEVGRAGVPMTLVLSSYETVAWTLDLQPGVILDEVILNGYEAQSVQGQGGATVTNRSGGGQYLTACAYHWPGNGGGCDTQELVSDVESLTGLVLGTFIGCYSGITFTLD
jgi:hypothetical protein